MKKVCVVTGTRAEYGLLKPLINVLNDDSCFEFQIIATGTHLSPEFGNTYEIIEKDGFVIDEKLEILMSSDTPTGIVKSMGLAVMGFGECYQRLKPDMVLLLGDRYETFAAASAATVFNIPIIHLYGGETTEGAFDEAFRHSITKMSHIHFTSTEAFRKRVIQLGEAPDTVFNIGAIGIENIKHIELLSKLELEKSIDFKLDKKFALITFHPVTMEHSTSEEQFGELLSALTELDEFKLIFTKSNSDTDGRIINQMIDRFVAENPNIACGFTSLGQLRYLSAMHYASLVIGNSSSGLIEAPSMHVPTINIGDRQKGRVKAESVLDCLPEKGQILEACKRALQPDFQEKLIHIDNPYEGKNTSEAFIRILNKLLLTDINLKKKFYDL